MYRAYHRWMEAYCGRFPDRLGGVILACARDVKSAVEEITRWGKSRWAWGVLPYAPFGMPLDHPDLEPIWAAAAAVLLLTVGITAQVVDSRAEERLRAEAAARAFATVASYERSSAELANTLERRGASLDPRTRAVLERSLRTIDDAIAEARGALDQVHRPTAASEPMSRPAPGDASADDDGMAIGSRWV